MESRRSNEAGGSLHRIQAAQLSCFRTIPPCDVFSTSNEGGERKIVVLAGVNDAWIARGCERRLGEWQ